MKSNYKTFLQDIDAVINRDPATSSKLEALLCSSGLHAVCCYRLNHLLWKLGFRIVPRVLSQLAKFFTGVEIHPEAKIGSGFFIDHGMGTVIGQTAEIGNNVTLYQDVTLGGTTVFDKNGKITKKRHPTLQDDVIVGSGAQILGPIIIGKGAKIGSNAVVVKNVGAGITVVGVPAHRTENKTKQTFQAYAADAEATDPIFQELAELKAEIAKLKKKVKI